MSIPKPPWLKIRPANLDHASNKRYKDLRMKVKELKLHTVCEEGHCPNMAECWGAGIATFMILGDMCTRCCKFCNIKTGNPMQKIDSLEPAKLGNQIKEMDLDYAVITSVDRDDLPDGGAKHFAECIRSVKKISPKTIIEVLIPDFSGNENQLDEIIKANPKVIGQNIETVKRLTKDVRDLRAGYEQTLDVLEYIKKNSDGIYTKSSIMVGMGESEDEVIETMRDVRKRNVDFITIGQYLQPSEKHYPLKEYITPGQFKVYEEKAKELGFLTAFCAPFVRSSYRAGEYFFRKKGRG